MELLDWAVVVAPPLLGGVMAAGLVEAWERWRYR